MRIHANTHYFRNPYCEYALKTYILRQEKGDKLFIGILSRKFSNCICVNHLLLLLNMPG